MFHNIHPDRKRTRDGGLTDEEKSVVKKLLDQGYLAQDIVHILNQGRKSTVNLARVSEIRKAKNIVVASDKELNHYIKVQSSYDSRTLLNPYKNYRLIKAREAMISAVQIFNSPSILFKIEVFCVLANIAWTYLLHEKMEQTEKGSSRLDNGNSVTLSGTLNKQICPSIDPAVKDNLKKITEIRDAVEHLCFEGEGHHFIPSFQACCINFDRYMMKWFGESLSLTHELSLALQFRRFDAEQAIELEGSNLPKQLQSIYKSIQDSPHANNNAFAVKIYFTAEVTSKTNADIHKLIKYDDEGETSSIAIKKTIESYKKLTEKNVIKKVIEQGLKITRKEHQDFWKKKWKNAEQRNKEADKKYGEAIGGKTQQWFWYEETWLPKVIEYCDKRKL